MAKKPPKWADVYPRGTKDGNEEQKFFVALARHKIYAWRSTSAIASESGLTPVRVEQIIEKYYKLGMVFQNPKNEEQWGYWERLGPECLPANYVSVAKTDQINRIKKATK